MNRSKIILTKRQRFIAASAIILVLSLIFNQFFTQYGFIAIGVFAVLIYLISLFALKEDLNGVEYATLFILPLAFTLSANLFTTLLPDRKLFRAPIYLIIPIGLYIIYLTVNIFNVAAIRTIQLLRAAHAMSYIITLLTTFFLLSYIISLHLNIWQNLALMALCIGPLTLQFLWSYDLISKFTTRTVMYTSTVLIVFLQIAAVINFYPQSTAMSSLFLVAVYYVLLGVLEHYYENKLTRKPTIEYTIVAFIIFVIMILSTSWRG